MRGKDEWEEGEWEWRLRVCSDGEGLHGMVKEKHFGSMDFVWDTFLYDI